MNHYSELRYGDNDPEGPEIDDLNILSVEFYWTYPYRKSARLRIEYLADCDDPQTLVLYGESAINAYEAMRQGGTDVPISDNWRS